MVGVLISPDVKDYQWSEFDKFDYFFNECIESCENSIMTIRRQISNQKRISFRLNNGLVTIIKTLTFASNFDRIHK
jgi:hypothetical protein